MENSEEINIPDTVTAVFMTRDGAERAYDELIYRGYKAEEITVLISNETRDLHFGDHHRPSELTTQTLENAGLGSAIGGTVGAITGAIAAIGTAVVIPGLGIAVAGPILASLTGAGAGGLTGGVIGALVGLGVPKNHATHYDKSLKEGGIIIGFKPKTVEDRIDIITAWNHSGGTQIHED